jgi:uncharacterized DUF497 family protein
MKDRWYHPEANIYKHGLDQETVDEAFIEGFARRFRNGPNYQIWGVTQDGDNVEIVFEELADCFRVFHARYMTKDEKRRLRRRRK